MASILHLLLSAIYAITVLQPIHAMIPLGSSLTPTTKPTSWLSPSGLFAFGFYDEGDGFAIGIWLEASPNKTVVWTANRDDPPVSSNTKLLLTEGGLQRTVGGQDKLISIISGKDISPVSSASMLDSGNFVLYNSSSKIIWETFGFPTDTILAGQQLLCGNQLFSSTSETNHTTGRFRLNMQMDGNLVLYPKGTEDTGNNANWASNTAGRLELSLFANGSINIVKSSGSIIHYLGQGMPSSSSGGIIIYRGTLDSDGIFRLYSHSFEKDNSSMESFDLTPVRSKCLLKGICGINSFCTLMDEQFDCLCLPGYNFMDPSQRFMGCSRNFSSEDCIQKNNSMAYFISPMKNMVWEGNCYDILPLNSEKDCTDKCLGDCICAAAMFDGQTCKKMSLPLKYGRRDKGISVTTLIKVGKESPMSMDGTPSNNSTMVTETVRTKGPHKEILIVSFILATCFTFVSAITVLLIYRRRILKYRKMSEERNLGLTDEIVLRSYSYNELQKATGNFREELGKGAFGTVYKGVLTSGSRIIAVKRLEKVVEEGEREFRAEMRAIGGTHHRNLVRLIGFCDEGSSRLLVYEYMSNGSLADLLFKAERQPCWNERVRIALDVARGIRYLHEDCQPHIIHCDIKPQNILMDDFWTAKISDFGLAKLLMPNQTRTFTGIRGTRGYLAPEWQKNTPITVKTDVYSYGIVLLETICCRRNVDLEVPENEMILYEWVYDCFEARKLGELLGGEDVEVRMLERMVKVGLWCIQNEPALRPPMKNVILMLEGNMETPIPPSPASSIIVPRGV